jgi:hypothetical protein
VYRRPTYLFATFPSSKRREGERETESEQEGIAGVSATYIPFFAVVSCFCHLPLKKKRRREKREYRVICVCEFTRCVRVCSDRETEREQEGIAGVSATYIPFCAVVSDFATFPSSKRREGKRETERERKGIAGVSAT